MLSDLDRLSVQQAITGDAASTYHVDVGKYAGRGEPIDIVVRVVQTFTNLTSLHVSVQECDTTDGTYADVVSSEEVLLAALVAGYDFRIKYLPKADERYIKLHYDVTGSAPDAGKIDAFIEPGEDEPYKDGLYFSPRNPTGAAASA